jgi:N-acetylglucosamine kinase-like BadF-type ATPase
VKLFLGVDGGQSSTTALIGNEKAQVIGMGRAGPINHVAAGEARAKFVGALSTSVNEAACAAGLSSLVFESACLGFSGGPADKEALTREVVKSRLYSVTHDAAIALSGATAGQPGLVVIAGTGSIAFGRGPDCRTARAGGWGYIFGDEGSGFDLVRKALRAVLCHEEEWGPPTHLRESLLEATGARDANDLLHRFYTPEYPRSRIAALAPLVEQAAAGGDRVAHEVLMTSAHTLATLAASVRRNLFLENVPALVSYVGGVFRCRPILERFRLLVEMEEGNRVAAPVFGPAAGALMEAYRAAGVECDLKNVPEEK